MSLPGIAVRIETHDPIEFQEATAPWDTTLLQIAPGAFHSQTEYVQVNDIVFYREHWNQRMIATGTTPEGYFVFGGSLSSPSGEAIAWCGDKANREQLAFGRPASEMEIIFPHDTNHIGLLIPLQTMRHYFGEELLAHALMTTHHHLKCNQHHNSDLITLLDRMVSKYMANPALLTNAHECNAAELQLMDSLAESFDVFHKQSHRATTGHQRRHTLHRAINISKNIRAPITVPELARKSGMSQRSLELAFHESLGISPRLYLLRRRLNSVHSELLVSDTGSGKVTEIALRWGFTELGRFAGYYKHLFGESPSVTLNSSKATLEKRLSDIMPSK